VLSGAGWSAGSPAGGIAVRTGPWRTVGRSTLDRWIVAYRASGFDAPVPATRRREPVCDVELLDLAVKLKRESSGGPLHTSWR
jgi:hypothetical protein